MRLDLAWHARKRAEDAQYVARMRAHRAAWTGTGFRRDPREAEEIERDWRTWVAGLQQEAA